METLSELIGQAHAAKARALARMERASPSLITYRASDLNPDGELAQLEREVRETALRAVERFQRLMMETHPAALHSYPEGPAVIEAMARAIAERSSGGE